MSSKALANFASSASGGSSISTSSTTLGAPSLKACFTTSASSSRGACTGSPPPQFGSRQSCSVTSSSSGGNCSPSLPGQRSSRSKMPRRFTPGSNLAHKVWFSCVTASWPMFCVIVSQPPIAEWPARCRPMSIDMPRATPQHQCRCCALRAAHQARACRHDQRWRRAGVGVATGERCLAAVTAWPAQSRPCRPAGPSGAGSGAASGVAG